MSSVLAEKLGNKSVRNQKPPIKHPQHTLTVALRFTIKPAEKRENYVAILNEMIKQVEKIANSCKTMTSKLCVMAGDPAIRTDLSQFWLFTSAQRSRFRAPWTEPAPFREV